MKIIMRILLHIRSYFDIVQGMEAVAKIAKMHTESNATPIMKAESMITYQH